RTTGGAFTEGTADTLARAAAHVADREDARDTGLQRPGNIPPPRPDQILEGEVGSGLHEALGVQSDVAPKEPLGRRVRADEEEYVRDVHLLLGSGPAVPPPGPGELSSLVGNERGELAGGVDVDVGGGGNPVHEVAGHALRETGGADEEDDPCGVTG